MAYDNHILNVLRSLPPPPHRDPAAGPTARLLAERARRTKLPEGYLEIPSKFREYYTADKLEIIDTCRSIALNASKKSQHPSAQNPRTDAY